MIENEPSGRNKDIWEQSLDETNPDAAAWLENSAKEEEFSSLPPFLKIPQPVSVGEMNVVIQSCYFLLGFNPIEGETRTQKYSGNITEELKDIINELTESEEAKQRFTPTEELPSFDALIRGLQKAIFQFMFLRLGNILEHTLREIEETDLKHLRTKIEEDEALIFQAKRRIQEISADEERVTHFTEAVTRFEDLVKENRAAFELQEELTLRRQIEKDNAISLQLTTEIGLILTARNEREPEHSLLSAEVHSLLIS
jgi:hypothetical protein